MAIIDTYFNLSKTRLFMIIVLCNVIIAWLSRIVLVNDIVFFNTYSEQLTYERSMQLFEMMKKYAWISYLFIPLILFLKTLVISIVLYTGIFFYDLYFKIKFSSVLRIVIASEIIFVFAALSKFIWFYLFGGNYDLNDLGFFYPLSLINLFRISEVSRIWVYPLQIINLFQIFYIVVLSFGMRHYCDISEAGSEKVVLSSYIPAMVIWIVLIMFISIDIAI